MNKKIIKSNNAPQAIGPYSQAVFSENIMFLSGQIPINPIDKKIPVTLEKQVIQVLENIKNILKNQSPTHL